MSIKKDESGRRWVQSEVEVQGTPEEVWEAIATGPGISAWFFPTEVDGREGGEVICHMAPGMDAVAKVTSWNAPHQFTAEGEWYPGMPPVATEWSVEARAGGTCIVRVVHSLFASTDDWDDQLESTEPGWAGFFGILRLYLTHFSGQSCKGFIVASTVAEPDAKVWESMSNALGLAGAADGQSWRAPSPGAPPLAGIVEHVQSGKALLRLHEPAPGIAAATAFGMGEQTHVGVSFLFYGDAAAATAKDGEPAWQAWMSERFPAAAAQS